MKTPEEIKKGLECGFGVLVSCRVCAYKKAKECNAQVDADALAYIQQLEDHIRYLTKMIPKWISVEERLPERNERVVVTDGKHTWDYGQFNGLAFCFNNVNPNPRKWNWKKHIVRHVEW